ncbi:MAG TPA: TrbG/VirB9 family P-type conjugative transfer protein [Gammaproteobacteria bacterium]|nr:TrbG/VirB9 family P-type conjugative transfer protein [Gammaproteobacteria bacterium]
MKPQIMVIGFFMVGCVWANPDFDYPMPSDLERPAESAIKPIAENRDVEAQVSGQYPALNRQESLPLGAIQHAWDNAEPFAGVYQVQYNPREVIRLLTREFMTTTIIFPAWENIIDEVVGDKSIYQLKKPKPNIVVIMPNEFVGVDSSITLIGESGHVYAFYVRSEGYNSENISDIAVHVRVPAPKFEARNKNALLSSELKEKTDYLEAVSFDPAQLNFDFDMAGDQSIAPERVYSDGLRTWFDYGDKMGSKTLPAIFAVIDEVDTPINVTREGTRLVAQALGRFTLKSGKKLTCVTPSKDAKGRCFRER